MTPCVSRCRCQIRAVVVYDEAQLESAVEQANLEDGSALLGEEVFLAQLHRRAALLNSQFQSAVLEVIAGHMISEEDAGDGTLLRTPSETYLQLWVESKPLAQPRLISATSASPAASGARLELHSELNFYHEINRTSRHTASFNKQQMPPALFSSSSPMLVSTTPLQAFAGPKLSPQGIAIKRVHSSGTSFVATGSSQYTPINSKGRCVRLACRLQEGVSYIEVYSAPVKTIGRMREKILEYAQDFKSNGSGWPLCANIIDPIRASVVCDGPSQILEVFGWFSGSGQSDSMDKAGMPVCRVKNKFAFAEEDLVGGLVLCNEKHNGTTC